MYVFGVLNHTATFHFPPDSSVVLTEDTDSFIIGQRVWVGGSKPGVIAFIGETQFAPGEWAGIVLDQPIGIILTKQVFHALNNKSQVKMMAPLEVSVTSNANPKKAYFPV